MLLTRSYIHSRLKGKYFQVPSGYEGALGTVSFLGTFSYAGFHANVTTIAVWGVSSEN